MKKRIVIISEVGWQGARELAIRISKLQLDVIIIIKGRPKKEERDMITKYKRIRNIFISRKLFAISLFIYMIYYSIFSGSLFIFVTKEKAEKRMSGFGKIFKKIRIATLKEEKDGFTIFDLAMNRIDYEGFLEIS